MRNHLWMLLIAITLPLTTGCSRVIPLSDAPSHDGFDGSTLSATWETDKIIRDDVKFQSKIVRSGRGALKITLHAGDMYEAAQNGSLPTERAELTEADGLISLEGKTYSYAFSMFLPEDFPIVGTRLVLAQWKQECPRGGKCGDNSPVLAIRYISGSLRITQNIGSHQVLLYKSSGNLQNRWMDFKFRMCFSPNKDGRIVTTLNDSLIVDYTGPTAYVEDSSTGYPAHSRFYFKMGLYRDAMSEPMTIYIDEYTKELLRE